MIRSTRTPQRLATALAAALALAAFVVPAALPARSGLGWHDPAFDLGVLALEEPPAGPWLEPPQLPGYRLKVRIGIAPATIDGSLEATCIPETACVSGAVPGRPEVFLRVVGPKPNGFLWPTLVKFSTSQVEVWVEQTATGVVRHYLLEGATPGADSLPGLFDRMGFEPAAAAGAEARVDPGAPAARWAGRPAPRATGPFEIVTDDGEMDLAVTYANDVTYPAIFLSYFEIPEGPAVVRGVSTCWTREAGYVGPPNLRYDVVLYSYDELRDDPAELLLRVPAEATAVPTSSQGGSQGDCAFYRVPVELDVDAGPILAGIEYEPADHPGPLGFSGFYVGTDGDGPRRKGWYYNHRDDWTQIHKNGSLIGKGYEGLMIRLDGEVSENVAPPPPPPPPPPDPPAPPEPPAGAERFESEHFPGFRFVLRVGGEGSEQEVRAEAACVPETLCLSAALPGRSELFLRVVGPKPNGRLWPTIVRFTTSTVEVWVEKEATGDSRYYLLEGATPGSSDLSGLFDRNGFEP